MLVKGGVLIFAAVIMTDCHAWNITKSADERSAVFSRGGHDVEVENVLGDQDGLSRENTTLNGKPALMSMSRGTYYYTLDEAAQQPSIGCVYSDDRNRYNYARVLVGECAMDVLIDSEYAVSGQALVNRLSQKLFSFDTSPIFEGGEGKAFYLAKIGNFLVYDVYSSMSSLTNSSPRKYIVGEEGCYRFKEESVYLVFVRNNENPIYLDVVTHVDPLRLQRLGEADIAALTVEECSEDLKR